jgi:CRISPR-associated exonuclease Cas4
LKQLCAQAICLEEMLSTEVPEGAVYDGSAKRRQPVAFGPELRQSTEALALEMHRLFDSKATPAPVLKKACKSCSLNERCFPEKLFLSVSVQSYYRKFLKEDLH